ncbi:protein kinase [Thecaphora frezii]
MAYLPPATPMGPPAQTPRKQPSLTAATPLKTPHRTPGGSKIDQTSATPIIDISAIECQKENVQPLARGRSAHALSNTLTMQHKQRQATLNAQRQEFEDLVNSSDNRESDDPLEAWTKYVKWCIDNYPSGQTHESGLVPLLERATRNFKDSEQYINDSRYLRLWILYARNVECARDIYNFLLANEIGTKLASLYEELAVVNEGQNMFEEADKIYKLGIARRANPIDRLKRRYAEYQQRILLHPQAMSSSSGHAPQNYSEALRAAMTSCGRTVLGHKDGSAVGPTRSNSANVLRGAGARIGAIGSSGSGLVNNGRKLAVFQDDDDERSGARPSGPSSGGWDDIGTTSSRSQENLQPDRMGSKPLKIGASAGTAKKPGSGLAVFRDSDDDENDGSHDGADGAGLTDRVLNPKDLFAKSASSKAPTETDLLRRNPLMHWEQNTKLTPDPADLDPTNARKVSPNDSSKSGGTSRDAKREKASGSGSSSVDRARKSGKSSSSRSVGASSGSSGSKQERHACPLMLLYPGIASLDDAAKSRGNGRTPTAEVCLEELLVVQKRLLQGMKDDQDPWAYLDAVEGQWLPALGGGEREPDEDQHLFRQMSCEALDQQAEGADLQAQGESLVLAVDAEAPTELPSTSPAATKPASPAPEPEARAPFVDSEPTSTMPSRDVFDPDNSFNNAVALNMRPKKKKNGKDATMRGRMSPTLVTKATMREVENMFNGDDSETDSDDSDDSDESSEEEDDVVAPLPSASLKKPKMMMLSSADIPPTPTPIGRHHSLAATADENQRPYQVHDENARVRSTPMRPTALGARAPLGLATPMRTPLSSKPVGLGPSSSSKPVYRDEDDEDDDNEQDDKARGTDMAGGAPDEAETPALVQGFAGARRPFEPMPEDEEVEIEPHGEAERGQAPQGAVYEDSDEEDEFQPNMENFRPQFQPLTPITEATYEMTRYTALSQSQNRVNSRMGDWRKDRTDGESEEDEEEGHVEAAQAGQPGRSHQGRRDGQLRDDLAYHDRKDGDDEDRSFVSTSNDPSDRTFEDRSHWDDKARFELTKGYTIAREAEDATGNLGSHEDMGKSFVIEDRDHTQSDARAAEEGDGVDDNDDDDHGDRLASSSDAVQHEDAASANQQASRQGISGSRPPNPCSPVDAELLSTILAQLSPPLAEHVQYVDLASKLADGRLASLQKRAKSEFRRSVGGSTYGSRGSAKDWTLDLAGARFQVLEKIGEGGYGAVFLAEDVDNFAPSSRKQLLGIEGAEDLDSSFAAGLADLSLSMDDEEEERRRRLVIKAESPPNPWEFYVLDKLRQVVDARIQASIVSARKFVGYADESYLMLEYGEKGTLLEVVNQAAGAGVSTMASAGSSAGGVEEVLAMFFTIELLRVVENLHSHQMIHGDLKIDNCLLRLDETPAGTTWSNAYMADGSSGWAAKGLTLIDFGRAIDLSLYPSGQTFIADWTPDARDCVQMREARPFTYQPDYHGIASIAFCLLFGRYIETTSVVGDDGTKRIKIATSLRRYWQTELWNRLFDLMLNPPMERGEPIVEEMRGCRQEMQTWLETNCNRGGKNLKGLIRKLEIWAMKRA